jgi:hypothetical protein
MAFAMFVQSEKKRSFVRCDVVAVVVVVVVVVVCCDDVVPRGDVAAAP